METKTREAILASLLILLVVSMCGCEGAQQTKTLILEHGTVEKCKIYKIDAVDSGWGSRSNIVKCKLDDGVTCYIEEDGMSCLRDETTPTG